MPHLHHLIAILCLFLCEIWFFLWLGFCCVCVCVCVCSCVCTPPHYPLLVLVGVFGGTVTVLGFAVVLLFSRAAATAPPRRRRPTPPPPMRCHQPAPDGCSARDSRPPARLLVVNRDTVRRTFSKAWLGQVIASAALVYATVLVNGRSAPSSVQVFTRLATGSIAFAGGLLATGYVRISELKRLCLIVRTNALVRAAR